MCARCQTLQDALADALAWVELLARPRSVDLSRTVRTSRRMIQLRHIIENPAAAYEAGAWMKEEANAVR